MESDNCAYHPTKQIELICLEESCPEKGCMFCAFCFLVDGVHHNHKFVESEKIQQFVEENGERFLQKVIQKADQMCYELTTEVWNFKNFFVDYAKKCIQELTDLLQSSDQEHLINNISLIQDIQTIVEENENHRIFQMIKSSQQRITLHLKNCIIPLDYSYEKVYQFEKNKIKELIDKYTQFQLTDSVKTTLQQIEPFLYDQPHLENFKYPQLVEEQYKKTKDVSFKQYDLETKRSNGRGIIIREDGSYFEGYFLDGKIEGKGRNIWPEGDWYEGGFKKGKKHGFGTQRLNDRIYFGEYVEDYREGYGTIIFDNGDTYRGCMYQDNMCGYGELITANGKMIRGYFVDSEFKGQTFSDVIQQG
ncbi:hypothetical protein ABPG74_002934 [Tetrahymena malaccensis]